MSLLIALFRWPRGGAYPAEHRAPLHAQDAKKVIKVADDASRLRGPGEKAWRTQVPSRAD
jgi:hypothetical protein